jgi:hypothetical protein
VSGRQRGASIAPSRAEAPFQQFFDAAVARVGAEEALYSIAELPVCIRFAGDAMRERIGPALAHLREDDEQPVEPLMTIDVWDSASTGTVSLAPLIPGAPVHSGPMIHYEDERLEALYQTSTGVLSALDSITSHAWYWCEDADALPQWEAAASIRQILHWWLPGHGVFEVHGGAVGTPAGGVLIVGRGGSGKSTCALSSIGTSELRYAGDDYVGFRIDPAPRAYALYSSGKLDPDHCRNFPLLGEALASTSLLDVEEKNVLFVHDHFPESVIPAFPLKAVLVPSVTGSPSPQLAPASGAAALAALAPSSLFQLYPPSPKGWAAMARLVRRLPCFSLELGADIEAIPATITGLLAGL